MGKRPPHPQGVQILSFSCSFQQKFEILGSESFARWLVSLALAIEIALALALVIEIALTLVLAIGS